MTDSSNRDLVVQYHDRTKHRLDGYARGPDTLDWDAQPDPFRRFDGAECIALPLVADQLSVPFSNLSSSDPIPVHSLALTSVSILLENALALSAWKQYGAARWSLRVNPSSGNLHPTETYVIAESVAGLADGVYHYRADEHALEMRCAFLEEGGDSAPRDAALHVAFSSVHWREAWKYGERAYRYCQHDVGHAMAAVSYSAAALGWSAKPQLHMGDCSLGHLLGLERDADYGDAEHEHPDLLMSMVTDQCSNPCLDVERLLLRSQRGTWFGQANVLDQRHLYQWKLIDDVSSACEKPDSEPMVMNEESCDHTTPGVAVPTNHPGSAGKLFRLRRSAQAFDGKTEMPLPAFVRCLDQLQVRASMAPWSAAPWLPQLHLILFVHRVEGLAPGLYAMPRSKKGEGVMRQSLRREFLWQQAEVAPPSLPLYCLFLAKAERTISKLSCQQSIAGDSCFSVAMLAEFDAALIQGSWHYRRLFWEAGVMGQVLYVEAEAAGLRGTGIGCYFDDPVHELLGVSDHTLQSLYHFTVGGPLVDHRITTLPPYPRNR
ncbi:MAG: SagB/ThcOx family dehydrogenase [Ketobacter sp.]|nr:SagB/ThcOx family dehydrogenase [Ketobacter sp.]MEC8810257.1 SagB/ThcOx family dehydrogenase [Pseudomonadota bacterium]